MPRNDDRPRFVATGLAPGTLVFAGVVGLLTAPLFAVLGSLALGCVGVGCFLVLSAAVWAGTLAGISALAVRRGLALEPDRLVIHVLGRVAVEVMLRHVVEVSVTPRRCLPFLRWAPLRRFVVRGAHGGLAVVDYLPTPSVAALERRLARAATAIEAQRATLSAATEREQGDLSGAAPAPEPTALTFVLRGTETEARAALTAASWAAVPLGALVLCGWNNPHYLVTGATLGLTAVVAGIVTLGLISAVRRLRAAVLGSELTLGVDGLSVRASGGWLYFPWARLQRVTVVGTPRVPPRPQRGCLLLVDAQGEETSVGPWWTLAPRRHAARLESVAEQIRGALHAAVRSPRPALLELIADGDAATQVRRLAQRANEAYRGGPARPDELVALLVAPQISTEVRVAAALALARLGRHDAAPLVQSFASPLTQLLVRRALAEQAPVEAAAEYLAVARQADDHLAKRPGVLILARRLNAAARRLP